MDFAWSDEQLAFRKSVIQFAQKELNYDVIEADRGLVCVVPAAQPGPRLPPDSLRGRAAAIGSLS